VTTTSHHRTTATVLVLAPTGTAACGGDAADTALNVPVIDTAPSGVVHVSNPGPTRWSGTDGWHFEEALVVQPEEGSPGEISEIAGLVADDYGNIYVMQRSPTTIKVYGPDGTWLRDIGREGAGPGEFRNGMLGIHHDTLVVQEPNGSRMSTFLTDGTYLATHPSQCCWYTSSFTVLQTGQAVIMGPSPEGRGAYYLTRMDGTASDTIVMPDDDDDAGGYWEIVRRSGQNVSVNRGNIPNRPTDTGGLRGDGKIVRGNTGSYSLVIGTDWRDTLRTFSAPSTPSSITIAERDSIFQEAVDNQHEDWRDAFLEVAKASDIPTARLPWTGVFTDPALRAWVRIPPTDGDNGCYDVFDADGILLGRVASPDRSIDNGFWAGDRVYLSDESESGLPIVRVFRLITGPDDDAAPAAQLSSR
jgi:hypothetical protein